MVLDVSNFEEQVLQASHSRPVLVDFWAPWCGPCRQLGPILERIASEDDAGFTLAKVNTDESPDVAVKYAIRSIPAVKLFVEGDVADEFIGALPESQVRRWLKDALPSETRRQIEEAKALIDAGDESAAKGLLQGLLEADPQNGEAMVQLARLLVFNEPPRAGELSRQGLKLAPSSYDLAQAVQTIAAMLETRDPLAELPEDPARLSYADAIDALRTQDVDAALELLVNSVRRNRRYLDGAARKASLALFAILGTQHTLTRKHRRALEMALF